METLKFIAACALLVLGAVAFMGILVHTSQRGKKGKNGVFDIDEYRRGQK